jgi:aminoglycoside/choline kinase family phosphotransferase
MQDIISNIKNLFSSNFNELVVEVEKLPQAGSERYYFRIKTTSNSYIATYGANIKENNSFLYFTNHFEKRNLAVPKIYCVSADAHMYVQEDFGNKALLDVLEERGFSEDVYQLYKKSLHQLALLQVKGDADLDYSKCVTNSSFGKQAIMADLLYFKYYFLDALRQPYDKQKLIDDFEALSNYLSHTEYQFFMFRDFQSRNIIVKNDNSVGFIDYQGGMKGAPQYDVASLLWQAKANLNDDWKSKLLEDYMISLENILHHTVDKDIFRSQYNGYVLIRLLQVLGAYGFRGLFERKAHFLTSIPLALQNLKSFIQNNSLGIAVPEFKRVLDICISDTTINEFTPVQATADTPLQVKICSFSFIKNGYPTDETNNGGGFVFDMRGILNPGRFKEYKHLSGLDKPVKDFLEQQTKMPDFLNSMFSIIDISVEDYIKRSFENLAISFGCTGGQHRSVYAAEALARHLRNKFKVQVSLHHLNQLNWKTTPES